MRKQLYRAGISLVALAAGCINPVAGTWAGSGPASAEHPIAGVSFCPDGTFTANADYGGGKSHAMSGLYKVAGDQLKLCANDTSRAYAFKVKGDCLEISHEGKTQTLCRVKGCCPMECPCCPMEAKK